MNFVGVLEEQPIVTVLGGDEVRLGRDRPDLGGLRHQVFDRRHSLPAIPFMRFIQCEDVADRGSGFDVLCEIVAEIDFGIDGRCHLGFGSGNSSLTRATLSLNR